MFSLHSFVSSSLSVFGRALTLLCILISISSFGLTSARAVPVTIPNASFESSGPAQTSTNPNVEPGWVFNVKGGSVYGGIAISSNFSTAGPSSGSYGAFINNDYPGVTDTITSASSLATIAPLTSYTLTVAVGNIVQADTRLYGAPGNVSISLLANGVAFATETVSSGTVANGTFQDFTLSYATPASGGIVGENLTIQLAALPEQGTAYKPVFDDVALDAEALAVAPQSQIQVVPEPSTFALLLSGACTLCFLLRRQALRKP